MVWLKFTQFFNHKAWKLILVAIEVDYGVFVFILGWVFQQVVFSATWNGLFRIWNITRHVCQVYLFLSWSWITPKEAKEKSSTKLNLLCWDSVLGNLFGSPFNFQKEAEIFFRGQWAADRCRWPVPIPGGYLVGCDVSEALDESQAIGLARNIGFFQGVHVFMETR